MAAGPGARRGRRSARGRGAARPGAPRRCCPCARRHSSSPGLGADGERSPEHGRPARPGGSRSAKDRPRPLCAHPRIWLAGLPNPPGGQQSQGRGGAGRGVDGQGRESGWSRGRGGVKTGRGGTLGAVLVLGQGRERGVGRAGARVVAPTRLRGQERERRDEDLPLPRSFLEAPRGRGPKDRAPLPSPVAEPWLTRPECCDPR